MDDTVEEESATDGLSFTELMKQAASIRTQQDAVYRRKFDSYPSWYQSTLGRDDEVVRIRSLPFADMIRRAQALKEEGNSQVKDGRIDEAVYTYTRCLSIFRWIENTLEDWRKKPIDDKFIIEHRFISLSNTEEDQVNAYLVSCYINLAIVYQKLLQWQDSIAACDAALAIDATCSKALYRRAQARILPVSCGVTENEIALADLTAALQHDPSSTAIKLAYSNLRKALQEQKLKDKKSFQGCLDKALDEDSDYVSKPRQQQQQPSGFSYADMRSIIKNLQYKLDHEMYSDATERLALTCQLKELQTEYTSAVQDARQKIIDAVLQIDMRSPSAHVVQDAAANGLDLHDENVIQYMISIQDKLRQGDMDFSTLPDEATLADILQHTHAAVQHDKATDIALKIVRSFTVSEVDLMISERNKHGDVKRSQYTTPTAILVEMIRDDILANASDDNADIMDKYGIKKEIERTTQNHRFWLSVGVGFLAMVLFLLVNLYRNRNQLGLTM